MALARTLFETIERKKVIQNTETIPFDTLKTLYFATFNRVGWTQGLMARPEVIQAEDRLNEVWLECMEGRVEDFKATLTEWEKVISKAIKTKGGNNADRTKD